MGREGFLFDNAEFESDLIEVDNTGQVIENTEIDTKDKDIDPSQPDRREDSLIDPLIAQNGKAPAVDTVNSEKTSSLKAIATALGEEGFISFDEKELEEAEDPAQFLRDKINSAIESKVKESLSPEKLKALDAFEKGLPIEDYVNSNHRQKSYQSLTINQVSEDEELQEVIIRNNLTSTGLSEAKTNDLIKIYKDAGGEKLKTEALSAREELIEKEKTYRTKLEADAELRKQSDEKARQDSLKEIKDFVYKQKEVIPSLSITDKTKEEVFKIMTTPTAKDKDGRLQNALGVVRSKDPVKFDFLLNYYYKLGLFNENPDFSIFQKLKQTKTAKGLDAILKGEQSIFATGKSNLSTEALDLGLDMID